MEIFRSHPVSRLNFLRLAGSFIASPVILYAERHIAWASEYLAVTPPPIVLTGFEPFVKKEDWNSSTTIVKSFQAQYQNSEKLTSKMYFLSNLPVNNTDPGSAARQIKDFVQATCPQGCIVLSLGEDPNMSANIAARIEQQSKSSPDAAGFPTELLPIWQLSDTFCRRVAKYIEDNHQNIFGSSVNVTAQLKRGEDTAGGYVCEETIASMNEFSYNQARASTPYPMLPIFIHVPDFAANQVPQPTINVVRAVAQVAVSYFEENSDHPEAFVTKLVPEERSRR